MVTLHLCKLLPNLSLWPLDRHSGVFVMANQSRYSCVGEGSCECYFWVWLQLYMHILTVGKALSHNIKIMYVRTLKHNRISNTICLFTTYIRTSLVVVYSVHGVLVLQTAVQTQSHISGCTLQPGLVVRSFC